MADEVADNFQDTMDLERGEQGTVVAGALFRAMASGRVALGSPGKAGVLL